jgi:hypothetical protein
MRARNDDAAIDVEPMPLEPRFSQQVRERLPRGDAPFGECFDPTRGRGLDRPALRIGKLVESDAQRVADQPGRLVACIRSAVAIDEPRPPEPLRDGLPPVADGLQARSFSSTRS